jgi:hypothetical protein
MKKMLCLDSGIKEKLEKLIKDKEKKFSEIGGS